MTDRERLTITLAPDMAALVQDAVAIGDYTSTDAVVRAALQEWGKMRAAGGQDLASLKQDVERGLADLVDGRVRTFDMARIVEEGRRRSTNRSPSA